MQNLQLESLDHNAPAGPTAPSETAHASFSKHNSINTQNLTRPEQDAASAVPSKLLISGGQAPPLAAVAPRIVQERPRIHVATPVGVVGDLTRRAAPAVPAAGPLEAVWRAGRLGRGRAGEAGGVDGGAAAQRDVGGVQANGGGDHLDALADRDAPGDVEH